MISKILAVSEAQRIDWSDTMVQCLKASDAWLPASGYVALFGGARTEPDILALIPWLYERGVGVAFFGIEAEAMYAYGIESIEDLRVGKYGVLEPDKHSCSRLATADLGVVLTPGIAFEAVSGHRMGRGAGYYDRFFSSPGCRARRIGVGFSLQFSESLDVEAHDIPMQDFMTEKGWLQVVKSATP
ncbi:5-formyltetrahydrofolate cyclo-ligase [soil metagenome]